jgi:hypothetical protein
MFQEHSPLLITSGASKVATAPAKLAAKLRTEESFILIKGDTKESLQLNYIPFLRVPCCLQKRRQV